MDNYKRLTNYVENMKKEIDSIKYKFIFDNFKDSIFFLDRDGRILEANKAAIQTYGYSIEELYEMTIRDIRCKSSIKCYKSQFNEAMSNGIFFETIHRKKNGTSFPVEVSSKGVKLDEDTIIMSIVRDISEKKRIEENLIFLANYDQLTNIANRHYLLSKLFEMCEVAKHENSKLAVIFFDIDKFKHVNDTYGHDMGDEVLKEISQRINKLISKNDILGRIGGDEFLIVQSSIENEKEPIEMINKIIQEFSKPIINNNLSITVNTSMGIAIYPDDSNDSDILVKFADRAMYEGKKEIGNTYRFYNSIMED